MQYREISEIDWPINKKNIQTLKSMCPIARKRIIRYFIVYVFASRVVSYFFLFGRQCIDIVVYIEISPFRPLLRYIHL